MALPDVMPVVPGVAGCGGVPLAQRLAPTVDRLRQRLTGFGLRPYLVFLVWTRWTGLERGEGEEVELRRAPIVPNPKVEDLTSLTFNPFSAGVLPVGSLRLSEVTTRLTADNLLGKLVPPQSYFDGCRFQGAGRQLAPEALGQSPADSIGHSPPALPSHVHEPNEFFYEVVEQVPGAQRSKFRPFSQPFRRAGKFDWTIVLERISEDRDRRARSNVGVDRDL